MSTAPHALRALQAFTPQTLTASHADITLPDARRILAAVFRDDFNFAPFSGPTARAVAAVASSTHLPTLQVHAVERSQLDPFIKLALQTADHKITETVRIPLEVTGRYSVCVSSQVGCALACAFCATGRMGLLRNLETWEIVEQVRAVWRTLDHKTERIRGLVFQGMGEPLANLDRVLEAIAVLNEPSTFAIDKRAITVCTSGLVPGIYRLAELAPKVRLGWSVGSARSEVRARIMPIEKAHPLDSVFAALVHHANVTHHSSMWAVTLLAGVNDHADDAQALLDMAKRYREATGRKPRISIIRYNAIGLGDPFLPVTDEVEQAFRDVFHQHGFPTHRRYSGGSDVAAACGQLAAVHQAKDANPPSVNAL